MIVSSRYKFVFVQTPKTGSTSMKQVLQQYQDYPRIARHATLPMILDAHPELQDYTKFGVTRDHETWRQSCYRWARRKQDHPVAHRDMTYNAWKASTYYPNWYYRDGLNKWLPAWAECTPDHWLEGANIVLRFESLEKDFGRLCKKLGIPKWNLPHMNRDKNK